MNIPNRRRTIIMAAISTVLTGLASSAAAQTFPSHPITIAIAFGPGSPTDMVARYLANDLSALLKQSVVVENKPGGSQTIAGSFVARARPDGYTLFLANIPSVVPPSIQAGLSYRGIRDFAPVAKILSINLMLFTAPSVPAKSLEEFVALLRANPGKYSYASSGVATANHLVAEMFLQKAGAQAVHVPYKGGGEVVQSLMSEQTIFGFVAVDSMQLVRAGKLKTFGMASLKRDPSIPDIPTMDEGGMKGFAAAVDYVLVAPKGTPDDVADLLNRAVSKVITSDSFTSKIKQVGGMEIAAPSTRAEAGAYIARQEAMWDGLVKTAHIGFD